MLDLIYNRNSIRFLFSLFNANPNLFVALNEHQIIKQKKLIYPDDPEIARLCCPVSELKKVTEITDYLGGIEIQIKYEPNSNPIYGVVTTTNEQLKFQNHWWFGWKEFHPYTEIWKAK